ncbi:MAG: hypothetical protein KAX31_04475 [Thermoplasmata archaeon]|nr:hypothetical protein [Thermoplasmata archaeon]
MMADKTWDELKESVEFYNAEGWIPRRDIRNTIRDLVAAGDKLKEHKADAQRMCRKLKAIETWFESEVKGYPDLYEKLGGLAKLLGPRCPACGGVASQAPCEHCGNDIGMEGS